MNNKLYVGGPFLMIQSEDELKNHFGGAGTVTSASIIMDRETNRSRGFGFRGDVFRRGSQQSHRNV